MSLPRIQNRTRFAYESLFLIDERGVPVYAALLQATYAIDAGDELVLLPEQPAINVAGELYGDPESSSLRLEPQSAFIKPATDIVLIGYAYPKQPGDSEGRVGIRVGSVQKVARVFGDRWLTLRDGYSHISRPQPFEKIPIVAERCFGGWDRRPSVAAKQRFEPRNPVGVGFLDDCCRDDINVPLPNFEDPAELYRGFGDTPQPSGFGFTSANWQPRAKFAGTYDEAWDKTRKPMLPVDFDRRFFNAASPGLIAAGHLRGDETVVVVGASPQGRIEFRLPGVPAPSVAVEVHRRPRAVLQSSLDTLIVDAEALRVTVLWRAHCTLRNGPHDLMSVELAASADTREPHSEQSETEDVGS